jgi:hypothetical protein
MDTKKTLFSVPPTTNPFPPLSLWANISRRQLPACANSFPPPIVLSAIKLAAARPPWTLKKPSSPPRLPLILSYRSACHPNLSKWALLSKLARERFPEDAKASNMPALAVQLASQYHMTRGRPSLWWRRMRRWRRHALW